jgi:phytoene synthase
MPRMSASDLAACRAALHVGSRSFLMASLLLPRRVRDAATALYAFCRMADDAIDESGGTLATLAHLHDRLDRACAGTPLPIPADRALAALLAEHAIPKTLPEALLEGFAWDAQGRRYETFDDLLAYATRVAGTVGAMMAVLMGVREPAVLARACDLGIAMQLSNIARDVGEDARAGRLYLPQAWLREAGVTPEAFLDAPSFSPALAGVVARLLDAAEEFYRCADLGIAHLPLACRPGIGAARLLYAEIGVQVRRQGHDSVTTRAVVPGSRKLALLARSLARALAAPEDASDPAIAQARYLVEAVTATPPRRRARASVCQGIDDRAAWLADLFARLAERDRVAQG